MAEDQMNQEGEVTFRNNLVNIECLKGRNREAWQAQWVYRESVLGKR